MQAAGVIERVKWERGQRIRGLGRGRPTDVPPPGPVTPGTIRILARSVDHPGARELAPEDLERSIAAGDLVWIDIVPGTATEMLLDTRLHLGPLTIEDCLVPLRMPKLDPLPGGGAFVAVFPVRLVEGFEPRLRMSAVPIVVGPRYIVTVQREPTLELSLRLEAAFNGDIPLVEPSGAALAHLAVDALVDRHLPVMLRTAEVAEELEERLNPQSERDSLDALDRLIILRRDLLAFRRLGVAQQEVLGRLGRLYPSVRAYLTDVADNQQEAVDTAAATCDYIDGAIEGYRLRRDARTEDGIRRLTVLAGILGPLSIIIGLWGVNFPNIPGTSHSWGWVVFVLVQLFFVLLGVWYFRRRGLL